MRLERHRGGAENANPTLGYLASYARIAIHTGEFSPPMRKMTQRTRNKIALAPAAALRLFPEIILKPCHPRGSGPRVSKNLDEIDLKILLEIQADGRITNVELAKRVGISPPPCLRRVRTLEEAGYIQGYRGLLDPRRLGFDVTVFASVHLSSQADSDLRAFEEFVRAEPLVRECWMLSGEVDFILKCVAPDMATFQDFVTHLTAAPHVRNVRTSLVLHNSKYEPAVPLDLKVPG
jgi:DNA-binding Lrp family transcriptional regulator